jgi:hypothetical protein
VPQVLDIFHESVFPSRQALSIPLGRFKFLRKFAEKFAVSIRKVLTIFVWTPLGGRVYI